MIPGPVELSPGVLAAAAQPPPSHTAPHLIAAFGKALGRLRQVWRAAAESQPFVVAGSGTLAMEMAAANLVSPGDRVVIADTGYFSERMALILSRAGANVDRVTAPPGEVPPLEEVAAALDRGPCRALFATHVDTSTGVRLPLEPVVRLASERQILSVVDGVCAAGGEPLAMADWGIDVYFTASQKALGLPPGLALMVTSERALAVRRQRSSAPPLYLDWESWQPILKAYEAGEPSYFATPATSLILALEVGLGEILAGGVEARVALHARAARALRRAWAELGLATVPARPEITADTISALRYTPGIDATLVGRIQAAGVTVTGGLLPALRTQYFRVGHLGWVVTQPDLLGRTVRAVAEGLAAGGHRQGIATAEAAAAALLAD